MTDRNGQDPAATDNEYALTRQVAVCEGCIYMPPGRHAPAFYKSVAYHGNKKLKGYQKGKRGKHGN